MFFSFQLLDSQSHCCRPMVPRHQASWPELPPVRTRELERNLYKQCEMVMLVLVQDGDDGANFRAAIFWLLWNAVNPSNLHVFEPVDWWLSVLQWFCLGSRPKPSRETPVQAAGPKLPVALEVQTDAGQINFGLCKRYDTLGLRFPCRTRQSSFKAALKD